MRRKALRRWSLTRGCSVSVSHADMTMITLWTAHWSGWSSGIRVDGDSLDQGNRVRQSDPNLRALNGTAKVIHWGVTVHWRLLLSLHRALSDSASGTVGTVTPNYRIPKISTPLKYTWSNPRNKYKFKTFSALGLLTFCDIVLIDTIQS